MAWLSRKQVRSQPVMSYTEDELMQLFGSYDQTLSRISDQYLQLMGEHLKEIGDLLPSDVHRLQQIRRMNKNLSKIRRRIANAAGMSEKEVQKVFEEIAQTDVRMAQKILGVKDTIKVSENTALKRIIKAQARETAQAMKNLSNTTVVSKWYQDAVDEAVSAVQSGVEDYGTAIRRVIREAGQSGLRVTDKGTRVVDYESGYARRLDSAARMNVLDGVRHLNQSIMEQVGRIFDSDGIEIDAHALCAEDHLPYQGLQFSNEQFDEIQGSLRRPFGEWNCRHSWHPIILGISKPTYSKQQLKEMRDYSTEQIEIDGRTKTRYQWSQEMRRVETAIRQQKDTATLARYSGDTKLRQRCQGTILQLNQKYKSIADQSGLKADYTKTNVVGFKDAKLNESTENERSSLRSSYSNKVPIKALDAPGFKSKFDGISSSKAVDEAIYECSVKALQHRNETNGEDLYLINGKTGEIIHALTSSNEVQTVKYDKATLKAIEDAHSAGVSIIALHNHPNGMPPSLDDGSSAFARGYDKGIVVGHNLEVFTYTPTKKLYDAEFCQEVHNEFNAQVQFEFDFDENLWYDALREFGMEVNRR